MSYPVGIIFIAVLTIVLVAVVKPDKMITFLAVLLTLPFLLIALTIMFVIILFSRIFRKKRTTQAISDNEADDFFYCIRDDEAD